jgi:hypothetical protein
MHLSRSVRITLAATAAALACPAAAHAAPPRTDHMVVTETDYFPKAGDDPSTFYGIFSLDGVCGFAHADYTQSDTETFFIAQHNNDVTGYKYNAVGKIDDESWTLTPVTADGTRLATFTGTADEVATAVGVDNGATPLSVNYSFHGTATNPAGQRLQLVIKGVLRTDAAHEVTRFDWGVQSCAVH